MSTPLDVLVIRDDRPGHYNQSEGIVKAVARHRPVAVRYSDVTSRAHIARRAIYALYNTGWTPEAILVALGDNCETPDRRPDLIVSAGGETLLPNAMLAQKFGCPNIFSGSIRNLSPAFFSAILLPYNRFRDQERHIVCLKPSPVDPDLKPTAPVVADLCVLVGGPSGTHRFSEIEWQDLIRFIEVAAQHVTVAVLTSRRTPRSVAAALSGVAQRCAKLHFADYSQVGPGATFNYYNGAGAVLVTEDSNSMITEAVCTRKPVLALMPKARHMSADEAAYLDDLERKGWLARRHLNQGLTIEVVRSQLDALRPMQANHLDTLAATLAECIPLLRPSFAEIAAGQR